MFWGLFLQKNREKRRLTHSSARGGSALIGVIWTIALLSLLVMSFTLDTYLDGKMAVLLRARRQADYLVLSGIALSEMLMERQRQVTGSETEEDVAKDRWIAPAIRLQRGQKTEVFQKLVYDEHGVLQFSTDDVAAEGADEADAIIKITLEPEPARWNINTLTRASFATEADLIWEAILTNAGVPEQDQSELVDSFYDWIDPDSTPTSVDGAEDDYYTTLDVPYKTKNGPLDTIGELAYIRGFNRNNAVILKGGIWNPEDPEEQQITVGGIEDLFTTHGDGKINVNAAPRKILMTIPEVDELIAGAIIEEREGVVAQTGSATAGLRSAAMTNKANTDAAFEDYHFKDVADLVSRVPGTPTEIGRYISVDTGIFRVEVEGKVGNVTRRAAAVIQYTGDSKKPVRYLRWQEEP